MLDGIDAGLDRLLRGLIAVTVHRDFLAQPMGLVDERHHFCGSELRSIDFVGHREDAAGDSGFDNVGAVLDLKADCFADRIGTVGDAVSIVGLAPKKKIAEPGGVIEVAAGRADAISGDEHARPDNDSFRDRIAQRHVDELVTAPEPAAEIAHGGEAGFDGGACVRHGIERARRHLVRAISSGAH